MAKWNGSAWSALGSGMNDYVHALAVDGSGNLYAGGDFTTAGGNAANRVAKWDGSAWSALGSGTNSYVYALALDGSGNLYAGGEFTTAGGKLSYYIGRWTALPLPRHLGSDRLLHGPAHEREHRPRRPLLRAVHLAGPDVDERTDANRGPDSDNDLTQFRVTGDASNIYFLARFQDITDADYPYLAVAVDTTLDTSGQVWLGDDSDTMVSGSAAWEREIVVNLGKTGYYDPAWNWTNAGTSYISAADDTIEISMPWSALGVTPPGKLRFTVFVGEHAGYGALTEVVQIRLPGRRDLDRRSDREYLA